MSDSPSEKPSRFNIIARVKNTFSEASPVIQAAYGVGIVAGIFLLAIIIALFVGIIFGKTDSVADLFSIIRDTFLILLAMQALLISIAIIVLILQVASAVNLVQNEVHAIFKNIQDTSQTVKGTTEFMSENVAEPVIESKAWFSALGTFFRELGNLQSTMRDMQNTTASSEPATYDPTPDPALKTE